ncbi:MAG TPA: ferritin, partial [Myxococcota bacterium]|nr:ferritin [Myxococcota bacterium]
EWPVNPNLKRLLDTIIGDVRWDFKYLGMQILVEGLAMAAFANLHQLTNEKLLKDLIHLVMRDESRHVAFGVLSLQDFYADMSGSERRDREDFVIEACELMRDRLVGEETADAFGFDREPYRQAMVESPILQLFRQQLFSRVVPNLRRLGLLSPRVRTAFDRLGILQFEDADPAAQDAALGLV